MILIETYVPEKRITSSDGLASRWKCRIMERHGWSAHWINDLFCFCAHSNMIIDWNCGQSGRSNEDQIATGSWMKESEVRKVQNDRKEMRMCRLEVSLLNPIQMP